MESFAFGLATACQLFAALTKPILFLFHCKSFHIVIYLDDIMVLVHSKQADRRAHSFLCSLLVGLGLHINFSKSDLHLTQTFCFLGLCWDTVHMSVSLPPDKLAHIQQLALSLLQSQQFLYQWPLPTVALISCHSEWTCYMFTTHPFIFLVFIFPFLHYIN